MTSEERFANNPMFEPKEGPGPGNYEIPNKLQIQKPTK